MLLQAYVYPSAMRASRNLLRGACTAGVKAPSCSPISNTPPASTTGPGSPKPLTYRANRTGVVDHFADPSVQHSMQVDLDLLASYDTMLRELDAFILRTATAHDPPTLSGLRSVPGIGKILSLVILNEIQDIARVTHPQQLASYARLVRCAHASAGKICGGGVARWATRI